MSDSWESILREAIAVIPAIIAAVSSVRNGRVLRNGSGHGATKKVQTKFGGYLRNGRANSDWHRPSRNNKA